MKCSKLLAVTNAISFAVALPGIYVAKRVESVSKESKALYIGGGEGVDGIVSFIMLVNDLIRNPQKFLCTFIILYRSCK